MVVGLITVAALTAKMATTANAGQKIMAKHAEVQREREERDRKR